MEDNTRKLRPRRVITKPRHRHDHASLSDDDESNYSDPEPTTVSKSTAFDGSNKLVFDSSSAVPADIIRKLGSRWTSDQDAFVEEKLKEGLNIETVAALIHANQFNVMRRIETTGMAERLPTRTIRAAAPVLGEQEVWSEDQVKCLEEALSKGLSYPDVAFILNTTSRCVKRVSESLKLPKPSPCIVPGKLLILQAHGTQDPVKVTDATSRGYVRVARTLYAGILCIQP